MGYGPRLYRSLFDTANRLSYTLYPVDVRGLQAGSGMSAEHASPAEARVASNFASNRDMSENAILSLLAHQTGGRAFLDGANRNALEQAMADTRSYYWLGFTPAWRGTDQRHEVRIRVRDSSLKVRSRRSFSDLSGRAEVTMVVESALLFGNLPSPRALAVEVGKGQRSGRGKVVLPVKILIPLDKLTFLPQRDGWMSEVQLRFALEDKQGNRNEIPVIPLRLGFDHAPRKGDFASYTANLEMRRMKHDMVVAIYDKLSGTILWTRLEVNP